MANELLQNISKDEIERAHFRSRKMFQMDMEHSRLVAQDEGRAEGHAEGLAEGRKKRDIEIAKNLLRAGDSVDKIVAVTGLTREEIEGLR